MLGYVERTDQIIPQNMINELKKAGLNLSNCAKAPRGKAYLYAVFEIKNSGVAPYRLNLTWDHNYATIDGDDLDVSFDAGMAGIFALKDEYNIGEAETTDVEPGTPAIVYFPYEVPLKWQEIVIRLKFDKMYEFHLESGTQLTKEQLLSLKNGDTSSVEAGQSAGASGSGQPASGTTPAAGASGTVSTDLSPDNKCPVQPTVYASPRWRDTKTQKAYNLQGGLKAAQIDQNNAGREYGLYFKFTPPASADGYTITRLDFNISDRNGKLLYTTGDNTFMQCTAGYYFAWQFLSLEGFFDALRGTNGKVTSGNFVLDVYFNGLWAGKVNFVIK